VILTIIGTVGVLAVVGAAVYFLALGGNKNTDTNTNTNTANANTNLNTNLGIDSNINFNANVAVPNINTNANVKTPTPTPTSTPRPSPSPSASPTPSDDAGDDNVNTRPRVSPSPIPTPRSTIIPLPTNRPPVNGGVLNGRAVNLAVPIYPTTARSVGASGQVTVQVSVDERGNVISAKAITGHPLLRAAAEQAARNSKIQPTRLGEIPVKTTGVLLYNFRNN
jgi:TonB family protein